MSIRPHQFKIFRVFAEKLQSEIASLRDAINGNSVAISDLKKEHRQFQVERGSSIREAVDSLLHALAALRLSDTERLQEQAILGKRHRQNLAVQSALAVGTWLAFLAAAIYAGISNSQLKEMDATYSEIQQQTKAAKRSAYMACLSAQAAQITLFQVQESAADSRAATIAAIQQAEVGIEAERANITAQPRMPNISEIPDKLEVPISLKNDGKSAAVNFELRLRAVLLKPDDLLRIDHPKIALHIPHIGAGKGYPAPNEPENSQYLPTALKLIVYDRNGQIIPTSSQGAADLFDGRQAVFIFGDFQYSDRFGLHKVKFCRPMYLAKSGIRNAASHENEKSCGTYNYQEDSYSGMPKFGSTPLASKIPDVPIQCGLPPD